MQRLKNYVFNTVSPFCVHVTVLKKLGNLPEVHLRWMRNRPECATCLKSVWISSAFLPLLLPALRKVNLACSPEQELGCATYI